jgi:geranylgeranyl diphosphate synthase type II
LKYEAYFKQYLSLTEAALEKVLPKPGKFPGVIHEAMRYAVFPGGKRFRPILALASCEAAGGKLGEALLPGISIELIHCYSLVHDDLPSLDNDDERRGKPTCHKQFGEAMAIMAGDGLLTLAFHILSQASDPEKGMRYLHEISTAAGTYGMIGGQVADLTLDHDQLNLPKLDFLSSHKTGKLIKAGAVCGGLAAGASKDAMARILRYGECLGLAFQMVDDILDGDGYCRIMKPVEIRQKVRELMAHAKRDIKPFGKKAEKLQMLADFLLERLPGSAYVAVDR